MKKLPKIPYQKPTIETEVEMMAKLKTERDNRAKKCWQEIEYILKNNKCEIVPILHISTNGISTTMDIIAK